MQWGGTFSLAPGLLGSSPAFPSYSAVARYTALLSDHWGKRLAPILEAFCSSVSKRLTSVVVSS